MPPSEWPGDQVGYKPSHPLGSIDNRFLSRKIVFSTHWNTVESTLRYVQEVSESIKTPLPEAYRSGAPEAVGRTSLRVAVEGGGLLLNIEMLQENYKFISNLPPQKAERSASPEGE